jgi:hypothetical protein
MKVFLPMPDEPELAQFGMKGACVPFDASFLYNNAIRATALPPKNWPAEAVDAALSWTGDEG